MAGLFFASDKTQSPDMTMIPDNLFAAAKAYAVTVVYYSSVPVGAANEISPLLARSSVMSLLLIAAIAHAQAFSADTIRCKKVLGTTLRSSAWMSFDRCFRAALCGCSRERCVRFSRPECRDT